MTRNQNRTVMPKVRAAEGGVPEDQWRRLHPISPIINAWKALTVLVVFALYQNVDRVTDVMEMEADFVEHFGVVLVVAVGTAAVVFFAALLVLYSWFAWRATRFAVVGSGVYYRSGILMRTLKHARLDRIQAVDVSYPLLGRLFGLGKINIEVAGGANSNLSFGYLKTAELDALRAEILARAAGVVPTDAPAASHAAVPHPEAAHASSAPVSSALPQSSAPVAPERALYTVPVSRLLASCFLNIGLLVLLFIACAGVVGFAVVFHTWGFAALAGIGAAPIALILGCISVLWSRFAGEFNFTAAVSPDGIRTRAGLLETRSQTVPPRRVHAVRVVQPWLWRYMGWYRVTITQAGYRASSDSSASSSLNADVLLPVGTRKDAELALWLVIRDLGVPDPRSFIDAALHGKNTDHQGFTPIPQRAALFDPLARRRRAFALTDTALVIRDGWLTHSTSVIPVERVQSIAITQGPWERKRDLADVHAEIVPGSTPAVVRHADTHVATELVSELRERAQIRRASEPPEKWMARVESALNAREENEA